MTLTGTLKDTRTVQNTSAWAGPKRILKMRRQNIIAACKHPVRGEREQEDRACHASKAIWWLCRLAVGIFLEM